MSFAKARTRRCVPRYLGAMTFPLRHFTGSPLYLPSAAEDWTRADPEPAALVRPATWEDSCVCRTSEGLVFLQPLVPAAPTEDTQQTRNGMALLAFNKGNTGLKDLMKVTTEAIGDHKTDWHTALRCFSALRHARDPATKQVIVPDSLCFQAMLYRCARDGRFPEAIALLNEMLAAGHVPDALAFRTVIEACQAAGQWDEAMAVFQHQMTYGVAAGVMADNDDYCRMITSCGCAGKPDVALQIFNHLIEHGPAFNIQPDVVTYNKLICSLARNGHTLDAMWAFNHLQTYGLRFGIRPDATAYATAIGACGRDQSAAILDEALEAGAFDPRLGFDAQTRILDIRRNAALASGGRSDRWEHSSTALVMAILRKLRRQCILGREIVIATYGAMGGRLQRRIADEFPNLRWTALPASELGLPDIVGEPAAAARSASA